jgi:hypothetical protein
VAVELGRKITACEDGGRIVCFIYRDLVSMIDEFDLNKARYSRERETFQAHMEALILQHSSIGSISALPVTICYKHLPAIHSGARLSSASRQDGDLTDFDLAMISEDWKSKSSC